MSDLSYYTQLADMLRDEVNVKIFSIPLGVGDGKKVSFDWDGNNWYIQHGEKRIELSQRNKDRFVPAAAERMFSTKISQ